MVGVALRARQPTAKLPMLISQKVRRLSENLADPEVRASLEEFTEFLSDRTALAHGKGKIWIDGADGWLLTLEWVSGKGPERRIFTAKEAMDFRKRLLTAVRRVEAALKQA